MKIGFSYALLLLIGAVTDLHTVPFRLTLIEPQNIGADCKALGDLNGDGYLDVIVADDTGIGLWWYEYPLWTRHIIEEESRFTTDMQARDIDGDGDTDIIVPDIKSDEMVWYRNPLKGGDGWQRVLIGKPYGHDVVVGDINADGKIDVVARTGDTHVFIQESPTEWVKTTISTGGRGGTHLGDLDGDNDLDIGQNGYWLEAPDDLTKSKWVRHDVAPGWPEDVGVFLADMNGDRRLDMALAPAESKGDLVWYEAPGDPKTGTWQQHLIGEGVSHVHTFQVADIDQDGDLDIITAEMEQSPQKRVSLYLNDGNALKWRHQVISTKGAHNIRVSDLGADGDLDIIAANFGLHENSYSPLEWWENLKNDSRRIQKTDPVDSN